jgi:diguanylate cyclase (GGDEF)-like protein
MIDSDHFKGYNDHYGHPDGDRCLQIIAGAIRDVLRDAPTWCAGTGARSSPSSGR